MICLRTIQEEAGGFFLGGVDIRRAAGKGSGPEDGGVFFAQQLPLWRGWERCSYVWRGRMEIRQAR